MKTQTFQHGGAPVTLETGHVARQAHGAVLLRQGDTAILATVVFASAGADPGAGFVPLSVEYRERLSAAGRIPGGWGRREGRLLDHETLTSRVIDRSLRPLLPAGLPGEVVVTVTVHGAEPGADLEALSVCAASAAVHVSGLAWRGPAVAIRVSGSSGAWSAEAPEAARLRSDLDWLVTMTREGVVMLEGGAAEVAEADALDALDAAAAASTVVLDALDSLRVDLGRDAPITPRPLAEGVAPGSDRELAMTIAREAFAADAGARRQLLSTMADGGDAWRSLVRAQALAGERMGGRGLPEVRPIDGALGFIPASHGSALFTRGNTQALVTATVGGPDEGLVADGLFGRRTDRFMLHYNFPSFSVGEARVSRGPGRREIGHGALARRALLPVLPDEKTSPQAVRVVSDILESDGSSSMATVCGASLALLDAGVPLARPVAGVAMGGVVEGTRHAVLTDITGEEDHLGDFDFKVAGTAVGMTAVQLDNKLGALPLPLLREAFAAARVGLDRILAELERIAAASPRGTGRQAPQTGQVRISPHRIGTLIGAGGKTVQELQSATRTRIDIKDDGLVRVTAQCAEDLAAALARIEGLAMELELGATYVAEVVSLKDFGAFVRIGGHEGLVHVSELAVSRVENVSDAVEVGQQIEVKVLGADERGRLRLSRKAALLEP